MIELEKSSALAHPLVKIIFRTAVFLALWFIFLAVRKQWSEISEWQPNKFTIIALFALSGIYGGSLFLLAEMWHRMIQMASGKSLSRNLTLRSYTETQIAKYLPGNVFHLIGRHTFLATNGFEHRQLARALALEAVFSIYGAIIAATVGFLLVGGTIGGYSIPMLAIIGLVLFTVLSGYAFTRLTDSETAPYQAAIVAIVLSAGFFICQGLVFYSVCRLISPAAELFAAPSATLSWIAGYVVPGAPGGLGIREFVQLSLNNLGLSAPEALIALALFRGVTILGDVMLFISGRVVLK